MAGSLEDSVRGVKHDLAPAGGRALHVIRVREIGREERRKQKGVKNDVKKGVNKSVKKCVKKRGTPWRSGDPIRMPEARRHDVPSQAASRFATRHSPLATRHSY